MTCDCLGTIGNFYHVKKTLFFVSSLPLFSNMKNKQRNLVVIAQMPHFSRFYVSYDAFSEK